MAGLVAVGAVLFGLVHIGGSGHSAGNSGHVGDSPGARTPSGGTALEPAVFSAGSCVSFPPTSGQVGRTVFLDAGHGGLDPGGVGTTETGRTIYEADETLPVELDAMALLRDAGYRVVASRTRASTVIRPGSGDLADGAFTVQGEHDDVAARDRCANLARASVLIGIYFDAGASAQDAGSITAYDADRRFSTKSLKLATLVQADVLARLDARGWAIPDDGVLSDASLGGPATSSAAAAYGHLLLLGPARAGFFSTPSEMPGALIEPLFLTDPFEGSIADGAQGQHLIAEGLAAAVEQYFGIPGKKAKPASGHGAA